MEIVFRFGALLKFTLVGLLWVHKFGPVGVCVWRGPTAHVCRVVFISGKEAVPVLGCTWWSPEEFTEWTRNLQIPI